MVLALLHLIINRELIAITQFISCTSRSCTFYILVVFRLRLRCSREIDRQPFNEIKLQSALRAVGFLCLSLDPLLKARSVEQVPALGLLNRGRRREVLETNATTRLVVAVNCFLELLRGKDLVQSLD